MQRKPNGDSQTVLFVDKFTHFIINIGNFVNKTGRFNKFFKKNLLSHIDITRERLAHYPERQNYWRGHTRSCKRPYTGVWDIY